MNTPATKFLMVSCMAKPTASVAAAAMVASDVRKSPKPAKPNATVTATKMTRSESSRDSGRRAWASSSRRSISRSASGWTTSRPASQTAANATAK